jgi:hypothetical protein
MMANSISVVELGHVSILQLIFNSKDANTHEFTKHIELKP